MKTALIRVTGLLTAISSTVVAGQKSTEQKPNILFILADDLGWNDLGCTGSKFYETPNLDKLAAEGVRFTQAYASCGVCSPSRASIMTGQTPARHGITDWIGAKSGEEWRTMNRFSKLLPAEYLHNLPAEQFTIAEALKKNGYRTFFCGKWHLGSAGSYPEDHGFDVNIGGSEMGGPSGGYFSPYMNPKLSDGPEGEDLSMRLANETAKFMKEHAKNNKRQPFLAFLSFYAVHAPLETTKSNWNYFREKAGKMGIAAEAFIFDRTLAVRQIQDNPVYAGLIRQMDDAVGVVLKQIRDLGLDKNTLIIFTSDNGGVSSGDAYATSNLPLRGGKGRQWEGGIREPLIISYSGCKQGSVIDVPVISMDFYPTILEFAGLPLIPDQHKDGISIIPLLTGGKIAERAFYWHYPHYGNQGGEPCTYTRQGDWKLIYYHEDGRTELYNLAIDQTESEPLNAQYPAKVKELKTKLDNWLTEVHGIMPEADPEYNPVKEAQYKTRNRVDGLANQEKYRKALLSEEYEPDPTWWGSHVNK